MVTKNSLDFLLIHRICMAPGVSENTATNNALIIKASVHANSSCIICVGLSQGVSREYKQSLIQMKCSDGVHNVFVDKMELTQ